MTAWYNEIIENLKRRFASLERDHAAMRKYILSAILYILQHESFTKQKPNKQTMA